MQCTIGAHRESSQAPLTAIAPRFRRVPAPYSRRYFTLQPQGF